MSKTYDISSSSDMKRLEKDLADTAMKKAEEVAKSRMYDVKCPHCGKMIKVPVGKSFCPYCKNIINLTLNIHS